MSTSSIAIAFDDPKERDLAEALAERLGLPVARRFRDPHPLHLCLTADDRLEVRVVESGDPLAGGRGVGVDLLKLDVTSGAGRSLRTPLRQAVGIKRGEPYRPRVLDATAGLGEDTWLLAAVGCEVTAVERHPVVHALLEDGLRRAAGVSPEVAASITLMHADASAVLSDAKETAAGYDVVLIDPMFPGGGGRKAVERKPMRVLRRLVGDDADAGDLLTPALAAARRRVVVKRPRYAPPLAGRPPTVSRPGKGFRFDVYSTAAAPS